MVDGACRSTTRRTPSGSPTTREYGLSGSIWTRDVGRALRVARAVEAGNLSVNSHSSVRYWTPFGGFKQSGLGRELGPDALARVHRDQERLHRTDRRSRARLMQRLAGPGRRHHRGGQRHRAGHRAPVRRRGRARRRACDIDETPAARPRRTRSAACSSRPTSPPRRRQRAVPDRDRHLRLGGHRVQQRRHLAARRRLDPGHRPGRLAAGPGGQPDLGLPVLQVRDPATCGARARARSSTPRRSSR